MRRFVHTGAAFSCGQAYLGALGHAPRRDAPRPLPVSALASVPVAAAAAGWGHSVFLCADGSAHVVGRAADFRNTLRHISLRALAPALQAASAAAERLLFPRDGAATLPARAGDAGWVAVAASPGALTALLTRAGELDVWGGNAHGQCGAASEERALHVPTRVRAAWPAGERVVSVALGLEHGLAATDGGGLYAWGRGDRGALGVGARAHSTAPVRVLGAAGDLLDVRFAAVEATATGSLAVDAGGGLWAWGKAAAPGAAPGAGAAADVLEPARVEWAAEEAEAEAAVARAAAGAPLPPWAAPVAAFPGAPDARVARADTPRAPVAIAPAADAPGRRDRRVVAVSAGQAHASILTADGRLWMVGMRGRGAVFDDSAGGGGGGGAGELPAPADERAAQRTPLRVPPGALAGARVVALRASLHHSYAITDAGAVWRWGWRGRVERWRPERMLRTEAEAARAEAAAGGVYDAPVRDLDFGYGHAVGTHAR